MRAREIRCDIGNKVSPSLRAFDAASRAYTYIYIRVCASFTGYFFLRSVQQQQPADVKVNRDLRVCDARARARVNDTKNLSGRGNEKVIFGVTKILTGAFKLFSTFLSGVFKCRVVVVNDLFFLLFVHFFFRAVKVVE